jgi:hypothetical protein
MKEGQSILMAFFLAVFINWPNLTIIGQSYSDLVYSDSSDCILYKSDSESNRIPEFNLVGYKLGLDTIPAIEVVKNIDPIAGDNTKHIQDAIDEVSALPIDANGSRGAVLLDPGIYDIEGIIRIQADGVVLRGSLSLSGDSITTTLLGLGNVPAQRDLIIVGNRPAASWRREVPNSRVNIENEFLPVGSRTLQLANLDNLEVGTKIIIHHPSTQEWLASIDFGAPAGDAGWMPGAIDIYYNRRIQRIFPDQNKIELDVPVFDHLDRALAQGQIYRWDDQGVIRECAIENLNIKIVTNGATSEDHAWTAILLDGVEDCWVRNVSATHFAYSAVNMTTATRVTVENCQGLEPHSLVDGSRRYNFAVNREANNILFSHCRASYARHAFISNGASSASGIVFYQCQASHDQTSSEGHRLWSQGLLYDNITFSNPETNRVLGLYNRGSYGTSHGWGAVHSVAWNVIAQGNSDIIIQKPPGRQNYAIGCTGDVNGRGPFAQPTGLIELTNTLPLPASLWEAQRKQFFLHGQQPDAAGRLQIDTFEGTSLQLSWLDIAADESGYLIEYSGDGIEYINLINLPANTTNHTFDLDTIINSLFFRISALSNSCSSAYSNVVSLDLSTSTQNQKLLRINLSPNPARGELLIASEERLREITIFDVRGLAQYRSTYLSDYKDLIDISTLYPGIYYLMAKSISGKNSVHRFIKQ